jgi:alcohol dehydrogenase
VRTGGHIATVGVHGRPATLHLESLWRKNVTISTGQVDTSSTPWLLGLVQYGDLPVSGLVTDTFPLDRAEDAYEAFAHGTTTGALKILLRR